MTRNVYQAILDNKIIVIIRGIGIEKLLPTAEALIRGGVKLIEVTFNQNLADTLQETKRAIQLLSETYPEIHVGAGTVMSVEQVEAAVMAGARYIISPHVDQAVITRTKEMGAVSIPGALTPTEIVTAYKNGGDFIKLFPMGNLGPDYAKAVMGPLGHIPMLAVGGVNVDTIQSILDVGFKGVGIGGNLVNKKLIDAGEFDAICELAKRYIKAVH